MRSKLWASPERPTPVPSTRTRRSGCVPTSTAATGAARRHGRPSSQSRSSISRTSPSPATRLRRFWSASRLRPRPKPLRPGLRWLSWLLTLLHMPRLQRQRRLRSRPCLRPPRVPRPRPRWPPHPRPSPRPPRGESFLCRARPLRSFLPRSRLSPAARSPGPLWPAPRLCRRRLRPRWLRFRPWLRWWFGHPLHPPRHLRLPWPPLRWRNPRRRRWPHPSRPHPSPFRRRPLRFAV